MKKTDLTLFICAILFCSPAFSMDIEEKNSSSALKIKSSNKQAKSSTKNTLGWYSSNNRIKIKYTETKEIGTFGGCKLYGYIDPSLIDPRWQIAFSKGFAKTKDGTNGVKFLNNRVFELKIDAEIGRASCRERVSSPV